MGLDPEPSGPKCSGARPYPDAFLRSGKAAPTAAGEGQGTVVRAGTVSGGLPRRAMGPYLGLSLRTCGAMRRVAGAGLEIGTGHPYLVDRRAVPTDLSWARP